MPPTRRTKNKKPKDSHSQMKGRPEPQPSSSKQPASENGPKIQTASGSSHFLLKENLSPQPSGTKNQTQRGSLLPPMSGCLTPQPSGSKRPAARNSTNIQSPSGFPHSSMNTCPIAQPNSSKSPASGYKSNNQRPIGFPHSPLIGGLTPQLDNSKRPDAENRTNNLRPKDYSQFPMDGCHTPQHASSKRPTTENENRIQTQDSPHSAMKPQPRAGYNPPPCGSTMIQRPSGSPYSPMRGGPMPQPSSSGSPASENRQPVPQKTDHSLQGSKKKTRLIDNILPQAVIKIFPEGKIYMDLLVLEKKLDYIMMKKRLDIKESLKRPMKQRRKLRIMIKDNFHPAEVPRFFNGFYQEGCAASWELIIEGKLIDEKRNCHNAADKPKFSSFFKSFVIEIDKDQYGPNNHLSEWYRTPTTRETDGFTIKRFGDRNVPCRILFELDYQPLQFKLDPRLDRLLCVHTRTKPAIISALWQYIKANRLQDSCEQEYIICDEYLKQIFNCSRMKISEIAQRLIPLLHPPDPIVINHVISIVGRRERVHSASYDIEVEVDDTLKIVKNNLLQSTEIQQEVQKLDDKVKYRMNQVLLFTGDREIQESDLTIHDIFNKLKTKREFFLSFANDPQNCIHRWIVSQTRDLKIMTDVFESPEEERRCDFYYQPCIKEAVSKYLHKKAEHEALL